MSGGDSEVIHTKIWQEVAGENPFRAETCYCAGFDVFGELIEQISPIEYLYVLFQLEPPNEQQRRMLNKLAVALANPGPRDLSVRAAMTAAVGGSTAASSLIAAISVGAGKFAGAREVFLCARLWSTLQTDLNAWCACLSRGEFEPNTPEVWPAMDHAPGFDPYASEIATPTLQLLESLCGEYQDGALGFLRTHRRNLESAAGCALAISGVAAAALVDIGFNDEQSEILYLLLRLPGAAAHAIEQREYGYRQYPFFSKSLVLKEYTGEQASEETHES